MGSLLELGISILSAFNTNVAKITIVEAIVGVERAKFLNSV